MENYVWQSGIYSEVPWAVRVKVYTMLVEELGYLPIGTGLSLDRSEHRIDFDDGLFENK